MTIYHLMNQIPKDRKGFTLVELNAVIAILVILCAVAIPSAQITLSNIKTRTHEANVSIIKSAKRLFQAETGSAADGFENLVPFFLDSIPVNPLTNELEVWIP